jgi:cytochrome c peroxidase
MSGNPLLRLIAFSLALLFTATAQAQTLQDQEELGGLLYNDTDLSEPAGQGCVTCHDPGFGFVDPVNVLTGTPVSQGVIPTRFGGRNSPSAGYAAFTPLFTEKKGVMGGQFWDGRVHREEGRHGRPVLGRARA